MSFTISILVDYAHEPEGITQLLDTFVSWRDNGYYQYVIHVISCDGAGRDDWKKPIMGKLSYDKADFTFITTDNYNSKDNPEDILSLLRQNLPYEELDIKYFCDIDRLSTMKAALKKAQELNSKVLICSTGVGSEQGLTQPDGIMEWDERKVWAGIWPS